MKRGKEDQEERESKEGDEKVLTFLLLEIFLLSLPPLCPFPPASFSTHISGCNSLLFFFSHSCKILTDYSSYFLQNYLNNIGTDLLKTAFSHFSTRFFRPSDQMSSLFPQNSHFSTLTPPYFSFFDPDSTINSKT